MFLLQLLIQYKYVLMVPIALVEGPYLMMISGFLVRTGFLSFWPSYILLMIGDLLGDVVWYYLGYFYGYRFINRFGRYFNLDERSIKVVSKVFHRYHDAILIVSKITMGLGFAVVTLFTAGMVKIPFRKYIALNIFGQFIWTGLLMGIGYFLGNEYTTINNYIGKVSLIAFIIVVVVVFIGFGKQLKKIILERYSS